MTVIREELKRVTQFKYLRRNTQEECVVLKWRSRCEWDQVGYIGRNAGERFAQKDAVAIWIALQRFGWNKKCRSFIDSRVKLASSIW